MYGLLQRMSELIFLMSMFYLRKGFIETQFITKNFNNIFSGLNSDS